jgi:hypothetical protein
MRGSEKRTKNVLVIIILSIVVTADEVDKIPE